jgi:hypothetical protein
MAEKKYFFFKRPVRYYLSYLKEPLIDENSNDQSYLESENLEEIKQKIEEI